MKIKPKERYYFAESETGIFHISNYGCWMCGRRYINLKNGKMVYEVDKSKVCKNCLKHTDAWEPVEDEEGKFSLSKEALDAGKEACANVVKKRAQLKPDKVAERKVIIKLIEDEEHGKSLYVDRKLLENKEAEIESLKDQLEAKTKDFAECCKELDTRYQAAKVEAEKWRVKYVKAGAERDELKGKFRCIDYDAFEELKDATAGHTLENICEIMKAAPPADSLDGYKLHCDYVSCGDNYWNSSIKAWLTHEGHMTEWTALIRTPIVAYIENDDITDEMVVAAGGRVPCEVYVDGEFKENATLIAVCRNPGNCGRPFLIVNQHGIGESAKHCRVKKSNLEQS